MLVKNIQLAIRNLLRDRFYTFINISGLSVGLAAALLLFLWVQNEYAFDNFHSKKDRLYRINANMNFGGEPYKSTKTPFPLSAAAKENVPEIEAISTDFVAWNVVYKTNSQLLESEYTHLVYPEFLSMFDFTFLSGDATTALENPNSLVLTESFAKKLLGGTQVIGEVVTIKDSMELMVTGIIKDFPKNSIVQIEALVPIKGNIQKMLNEGSRHWGSNNFFTYALTKPNANIKTIEQKLTNLPPIRKNEQPEERTQFKLQAVPDIYLGSSDLVIGQQPAGDVANIRLMSIIGLLILLIACINYVNLSTARAAHRAKSVSVQKIIGASRFQLFRQHFVEATCVVLVASVLAVGFADLALPAFEQLINADFPDKAIISVTTLPILLLTIIGTILLSGIQPALHLTAFQPIAALKGNQFKGQKGKIGLRKILVIGQFTCSAALIICTLIMMQQMDFVRQSKLGYEKEHIFSFWQDAKKSNLIKADLLGETGVVDVTLSNRKIADINSQYGSFSYEGMPKGTDPTIYNAAADVAYKDFFNLSMKEGRWFQSDDGDTKTAVINEAAAKAMQMENPVGKWIDFWGRKLTIVGVVKDFHYRSFHHKIEPLLFEHNPNWYYNTYVKTTGTNAARAIAAAEKVYKQHHPNSVFNYEFLDETYDNLYKSEQRMSKMFSVFALLTIFISCLGIFGLATYTAERRGKEIGIRKVLGANVLNIVNLLSLDFLKLVLISLLIAAPLAWYFMTDWLKDFAFSITIGWGVFALTALATLLIAYFTIGFQSLRAALVNPAQILKSE